jgi:hypothetical protein
MVNHKKELALVQAMCWGYLAHYLLPMPLGWGWVVVLIIIALLAYVRYTIERRSL